METVGQKIRQLIQEKGYRTVKDFYSKLTGIYGKSSINRSTLTRLLKDQVIVRERTLNQIAIILGVKTSFLREGTTAEVSAIKDPESIFTYNNKASSRILKRYLPFGVEQITLKNGGRTADLQDDPEAKRSLKWIFVLVGKINVVIKGPTGEEIRSLHKSQDTHFDAQQLHYIENASKSTSICLSIHYPSKP
jgi:hypothetical protein